MGGRNNGAERGMTAIVREIPLTQGKFAKIDDEDFSVVNRYKWFAVRNYKTYYARTYLKTENGKILMPMHRLILRPPHDMPLDHKNGDGLDNRRSNLRLCNQTCNQRNRRTTRGTSRFKGVCWSSWNKKWVARIRINKHLLHLGYFADEISAALAYDDAANLHFGDFARLNFPERRKSYA